MMDDKSNGRTLRQSGLSLLYDVLAGASARTLHTAPRAGTPWAPGVGAIGASMALATSRTEENLRGKKLHPMAQTDTETTNRHCE